MVTKGHWEHEQREDLSRKDAKEKRDETTNKGEDTKVKARIRKSEKE